MTLLHSQETLVETLLYNGISVDVVRWDETIWCGSLGYADKINDDLDVGAVSDAFMALDTAAISGRLEPNCNVLLNLHHIVQKKPAGVMFAYLVNTEEQPDGYDVFKVPAGQYMRLPLGDNNIATAIGAEPWYGGPPPWPWVSEYIAPRFGYVTPRFGADDLPVIEYYIFGDDGQGHAWFYVPVEKV